MNLKAFIKKYDKPCESALGWLKDNNITDAAEAWDRCERGDWLWWTLLRTGVKKHENIQELCAAFVEDCKSRADADARAYADAYADAHAHARAHARAYADAYARAYAYADAYADAHAYARAYADARAYAHAHADAYADARAYAHAHADAYADEYKKQADWIHAHIENPFTK